jgi:16S rRNA (cytidine1402-2'-O)-methyltransferase
VICEELRAGSTLLKSLGIERPLLALNEHNEQAESAHILARLQQGQSLALISDCGTPVFADPGRSLLAMLHRAGITVVPVPGPSSLMAALSVCDFALGRFVFGGFLERTPEERRRELGALRKLDFPLVLMDAPYRMAALLQEVARVFGPEREVLLACDMTLPGERIYQGTLAKVIQDAGDRKAEFVLVVAGPPRGRSDAVPRLGLRPGTSAPRPRCPRQRHWRQDGAG